MITIRIPALLKWIGNKQRFADTIISYMPQEFNNYYEPFLGSGAVMAALLDSDANKLFPKFKHAYGSDVLPFLIDIFNLAKNNPIALSSYYREEIEKYKKDPDLQYNLIKNKFNNEHNPFDFLVLSRTCYGGVIRFRKTDGYMSTPRGPHNPISPEVFEKRLLQWHTLIQKADFDCMNYTEAMNRAQKNDVIYCDPPYTHSQSILYGAQSFDVEVLWKKIAECKARGVKVMLSINGKKDSGKTDIAAVPPEGLFERQLFVDCGISMVDRLQNSGKSMKNKKIDDQLLLTW